MFPLERIEDIKNHPNDFKLLERVPLTRDDVLERLPLKLADIVPGERLCAVVFLDTETTGMSAISDKIIELGMVRCTFSFDRKIILSVDRYYDAYEDPGCPIPPEITQLTGISDEMVRGKHFDDSTILNFFVDHPLVVAHNARFDRPFIDRRFGAIADNAWACSQREIKWSKVGFNGAKLEFLLQASGYFYDAHRACNDTLALCHLMHMYPDAFAQLIDSSLSITYRIDAYRSPFNSKDVLKEHNYRWDADKKVWYIQVNGQQDAIDQVRFLETVYPEAKQEVQITAFTAKERYRS